MELVKIHELLARQFWADIASNSYMHVGTPSEDESSASKSGSGPKLDSFNARTH